MSSSDHQILRPKREGQRRLLSLDGGGIRGLVTLGMLERLEEDLRATAGDGQESFRLCDYFDFIGGTSTGAIIAAGLSLGLSVAEIVEFYTGAGPVMFRKESMLFRVWRKYRDAPLRDKLQDVFGAETTLGSERLRSLLLIVTRNATTDSPWPLSNNPLAKYNDSSRPDCNLNMPLWKLVRASTAAPGFFRPEVEELGDNRFVFVDGGVTPYNNPAFLMFRMAVAPAYRLGWPASERELLLVSLGTGAFPQLGLDARRPNRSLLGTAARIGHEMMSGMAYDQDINCRAVGRCAFGPELDGEVGDMTVPPDTADAGRAFTYVRYNPELTQSGLEFLGIDVHTPEKLVKLDATHAINELLQIGRTYARMAVETDRHLARFL